MDKTYASSRGNMKAVKIIFSIIYGLIIVFLIVIASSTALASLKLPIEVKLFVVQSGSMEPSIKTGSVVVVKNETSYRINDVITFFTTDKRNTTTHRIFNIKESNYKPLFITKGDANQAEDREGIKEENILGKVIFTIPYLGYVVSFTKTQMGFIFLIVVPAVIIIFSEILNLKKEVLKLIEKRKTKNEVLS